MNRLLDELIEHIVRLLPPLDRVNSALISRTWARTLVDSPPLLENIWILIFGPEIQTIVPVVISSQREYRNLRVFGADLSSVSQDLWTKVGKHLRRLEIIECQFTADVLYFILRNCQQLEHLALSGHSMMNPSLEKLATSAETCLNDVRESLRNVRHLHLDVALTAEVLDHFLGLMPNATAFFLRSDLDTDSWEVPTTLLKANHTFTKLDLQLIYLVDEDLMDLVTKCSESLEELLVDGSFFTFEGCSAVGDFKKLRHLFLENAGPFDDDHLAKLFRNNPDLETLDIRKKNSLTGASLGQLPDLRRFRRLSLRHCDYISNEALCGLGRLDTLEHLDLVGTWWGSHISYLESFTSLRDLRSLKLDFEINSEGLDLICETFRKLETLHLESCGELTDADGLKFRLMEHLKDLRISYCSRFSDSAFEKGLGSPAMENLKVGSISLTDTGLAHIAAHHGRLEKLTLTGCKKVTDAGLASILRRGRHLRKLRLDDCPSISTGCPEELENFCPRLRSLKISRTPMQSQAFDLFRRRRPFVDVKFRA